MVEDVVYEILSNDASVTGIVGDKIYFERVPQVDAHPYIVYTYFSDAVDDKDGFTFPIYYVQIDCYSDKSKECRDMCEFVKTALNRYPHGTVAGHLNDGISYLRENSLYDDIVDLHRIIIDFKIRLK